MWITDLRFHKCFQFADFFIELCSGENRPPRNLPGLLHTSCTTRALFISVSLSFLRI